MKLHEAIELLWQNEDAEKYYWMPNKELYTSLKYECWETHIPLRLCDIQATTECGFTQKRVSDMTRTYTQMHRTDKYSEHSSVIWAVWPNGWVLVYELSGSGFESSSSHLNFRFRACFEQEVPWHSGNYRVWIQSEKRAWHDKNIQRKAI